MKNLKINPQFTIISLKNGFSLIEIHSIWAIRSFCGFIMITIGIVNLNLTIYINWDKK